MSTVAEVIQATQKLAPEERWELYRQLREAADIQQHQLAELRRDVQAGVQQIESGDMAPLDIQAIRNEVANHPALRPKS
jgi:predicted transcriptional regulator